MTAVLPPRIVPTLDEVRAGRVLPSMSDSAAWTAKTFAEIAEVDPFDAERAERGSENRWRKDVDRPVNWGWPK